MDFSARGAGVGDVSKTLGVKPGASATMAELAGRTAESLERVQLRGGLKLLLP